VRFERFRSVGPSSVLAGGCRRESRIHRYTLYASLMPTPLKRAMALCRVTGLDNQVGGPPSGAGVFHFGQGKDNPNVTLSAPAVCKCLGLAVVDSLWDFDDDPSLTEGDSLKLRVVTRRVAAATANLPYKHMSQHSDSLLPDGQKG
jgi:hypothetical protein